MNAQISFGLIGCGGIGALRAQAIARTPGARPAAVCDVDHGRATALAQRANAAVAADWRELVSHDDINAVIVSTPPHLHAEMCMQALAAGKDVLCEKPLARTVAEGRDMVDTAIANGRLLATGFNYRFYPSIRKARELLDSGMIGELDHVRSYAGYSAKDHNPQWVHDAAVMGGGALRDNGIHLIDLTRYFLGDVVEVKGFTSDSVWGFAGCEDNGFGLLRNDRGRVAALHASWTEWAGYRFLIEIYGTRGCIRTWCFPMRTEVLWFDALGDKPRRKVFRFPLTFIKEHTGSYRALVVESFVHELQAFACATNGDRSHVADGIAGLQAIEIADQIQRAAGANSAAEPLLMLPA